MLPKAMGNHIFTRCLYCVFINYVCVLEYSSFRNKETLDNKCHLILSQPQTNSLPLAL